MTYQNKQDPIYKAPGRPETKDWEALRPEMQRLIDLGFGTKKIAEHIGGVTQSGLCRVFQRMGLATRQQTLQRLGLEALIEKKLVALQKGG